MWKLARGLTPALARAWRVLPEWLQWRLMWLYTPKFTVGVTGIVFDGDGKVMLLKHTFRRKHPWGLVSGWVKRGESLTVALHREVDEETSLAIAVDELLSVRKDRLGYMMEAVYRCRLVGGTFRPSGEVTEIRWCAPDALPAGVHPDQFPLIRAAAGRLGRPVAA